MKKDRREQARNASAQERSRRSRRTLRFHGFILEKASMENLRRLLADAEVRSVNIVDVAFDL